LNELQVSLGSSFRMPTNHR